MVQKLEPINDYPKTTMVKRTNDIIKDFRMDNFDQLKVENSSTTVQKREPINDYPKTTPVKRCNKCYFKIKGNEMFILASDGFYYHSRCFTCCFCGQNMTGQEYFKDVVKGFICQSCENETNGHAPPLQKRHVRYAVERKEMIHQCK